jgi:simple sugar transport system permease protein
MKSLPVLFVLFIAWLIFLIASPDVFSQPTIYLSHFRNIPAKVILALGLTLVVTAGEIDLSFGSIICFSGFVLCWCINVIGPALDAVTPGLGALAPWIGLVAAVGSGVFIGFINGILVARVGIPSIMATLAAQFFWFGTTVLLCQGNNVYIGDKVEGTLIHTIFAGSIGGTAAEGGFNGLPSMFLWAVGLTVLLWFLLNRHKFGEAILFIGDNKDVAQVMGINVKKTKTQLFALQGGIAGFAAVIYMMEMVQFYTNQGDGLLMPVIAAVFIGGTSMSGGDGSIVGSFLGMFLFESIEPNVVATGVGGFYGQMIKGLVTAAALSLNVIIGKIRDRQKKWGQIIKEKIAPKSDWFSNSKNT